MPKKGLMAALPKGMRKELSKQYSPEEFERLIESVGGTFYDFSQQYTQALSMLPRGVGKVLAQTIAIMIGNTIKAAGHFDVHSDTIMPDGRKFSEWEVELDRLRRQQQQVTIQLEGGVIGVNELMELLRIIEIQWGADKSGDYFLFKIRREAFHKPGGVIAKDIQRIDLAGKAWDIKMYNRCYLRAVGDWEDTESTSFKPAVVDDPVNPVVASKRHQELARKCADELSKTLGNTSRARKFTKTVRKEEGKS